MCGDFNAVLCREERRSIRGNQVLDDFDSFNEFIYEKR